MSDEERQEELGGGTGRQGAWAEEDEDARAAKQQADPGALEVERDPRGGLQSEEYRLADPRDLVEEGGTVMGAPGGAPQEERSIEERREASRAMRERAFGTPPRE